MRASIRSIMIKDLNWLMDIDIKSYEYPWSIEQWKKLADGLQYVILVALVKNVPVGFVAYDRTQGEVEILRIAVKPSYRRKGIGTKLLYTVEKGAGTLNRIRIVVPEIQCFPGHEDDVSQWLLKRGYVAVPPILKNHFQFCGNNIDGFTFIKEQGRCHAKR